MVANYEQPDDVVTRVRYFDGQYLQDQDFIDDQHYHIDRQRRHQRLLHVSGIAEGLSVTQVAKEATQVQVARGSAIDGDGRLIVLTEDALVSLADHLGKVVNLYLVFHEEQSERQASGTDDYRRWSELALVEVVETQSAHDFRYPPVFLARIVLNNAAIEQIDASAVVYSGLRLPGPAAIDPVLRTTPGGNALFTGTFTVDGSVGVGTQTPQATLQVNGSARTTSLTVDTATTLTGAVSVPAATLSFGATVRQMINLWSTDYGIGVQSGTQYFRSGLNFAWYQAGTHNDAEFDAGRGGKLRMALKGPNLGLGTASPAQRLTVVGDSNDGKDPESKLANAGTVAIKGKAPQIDFLDTDGNDWAIHVNNNQMYFVREPWTFTDLVLDGAGNVGIGTARPQTRLHVEGDARVTNLLQVGGDLTSTGALAVGGNTTVHGSATVGGALSFGSTTRQMVNLWSTGFGIGVQSGTQYFRTDKNFAWYSGGVHNDGELNAGAGGTAQMVLKAGNLGIGTGNPTRKLQVDGEALITKLRVTGDLIVDGQVSAPTRLTVLAGDLSTQKDADSALDIGGQITIKGTAPQIDFIDTDHNDWAIHVNNGRMYFVRQPWIFTNLVLHSSGNVGIGTDSPQAKLEVQGSVQITGEKSQLQFRREITDLMWRIVPEWDFGDKNLAFRYHDNKETAFWVKSVGGFGQPSDARLKKDVAPLHSVLPGVLRLRPSSYRHKAAASDDSRSSVGFVAQDVGQVFPDLVDECGGYLGLCYGDFAVLAIAAIQEQQEMIADLRNKVDVLVGLGAGVPRVPEGPAPGARSDE